MKNPSSVPKGWLPDELSGNGSRFCLRHDGLQLGAEYPFKENGEFDEIAFGNRFNLVRTSLWYACEQKRLGFDFPEGWIRSERAQ